MRIRKGSFFYVTTDGSMCWCQKCYAGLHSVLPAAESNTRRRCEDVSDDESVSSVDPNASADGTQVWYKRDLLKRKFDDEVAEGWVKCKVRIRDEERYDADDRPPLHPSRFVPPAELQGPLP